MLVVVHSCMFCIIFESKPFCRKKPLSACLARPHGFRRGRPLHFHHHHQYQQDQDLQHLKWHPQEWSSPWHHPRHLTRDNLQKYKSGHPKSLMCLQSVPVLQQCLPSPSQSHQRKLSWLHQRSRTVLKGLSNTCGAPWQCFHKKMFVQYIYLVYLRLVPVIVLLLVDVHVYYNHPGRIRRPLEKNKKERKKKSRRVRRSLDGCIFYLSYLRLVPVIVLLLVDVHVYCNHPDRKWAAMAKKSKMIRRSLDGCRFYLVYLRLVPVYLWLYLWG